MSHYEKTLELKPRAKVMAYREKLLGLDSNAATYVAEICRRDRNTMNQQILTLYALWEEHGTERFLEAIQFCLQSQVYGAAYMELVLRMPPNEEAGIQLLLSGQPIQSQIDRDLTIYDTYTHRRIQGTEESQKLLRSLAKVDLLIIDEFGYLPHDEDFQLEMVTEKENKK